MTEGGDWDETGPRGEDVGDRPCTSGSRWAGGRSGWGARWGAGTRSSIRGRRGLRPGTRQRRLLRTRHVRGRPTCDVLAVVESGEWEESRGDEDDELPSRDAGQGSDRREGRAFVAPPPEQCRRASIAVRICRLRLGGRRVTDHCPTRRLSRPSPRRGASLFARAKQGSPGNTAQASSHHPRHALFANANILFLCRRLPLSHAASLAPYFQYFPSITRTLIRPPHTQTRPSSRLRPLAPLPSKNAYLTTIIPVSSSLLLPSSLVHPLTDARPFLPPNSLPHCVPSADLLPPSFLARTLPSLLPRPLYIRHSRTSSTL